MATRRDGSRESAPGEALRIDLFLKRLRLVKRRSVIKKLCEADLVTVNGQPVRPARLVRAGDRISLPGGKLVRVTGIPGDKSVKDPALWFEIVTAGSPSSPERSPGEGRDGGAS